jgi:putative ABC transport system permease protein
VYGEGAFGSVLGVLLSVSGGFVIAFGAALILIGLSSIFQYGPLLLGAGIPLVLLGLQQNQAFPFGAGLSMAIIGSALLVRFLGAPARPVFTTMGLVMLFFWLLLAGGNSPWEKVNELNGDIEMFFLSGVTMVIAGTFVLVYNADLLLMGLTLLGRVFASLVPPIKTAVAYPLANKFRTGMTIAMISLVMFALVMFSTMNENFDRIFLSDDALAGYDVIVSENPGNPIGGITGALANAPPGGGANGDAGDGPSGAELAGRIAGDDTMSVASRQVSKVRQLNIEDADSNGYSVYGVSPQFLEHNEFTFSARATGMATDEAVRQALASNPDYVVIDQFAAGGDGFGGAQVVEGIEADTRSFDPVPLRITDSSTGQTRDVELIGVLTVAASGLYGGVFMQQEAFDSVFATESTLHYIRLIPSADANETAKGIERMLLSQGVQADSLRQVVDDYQAQSRGFLYLMQAFMGIGLFVGIAAVGVIAFRTVVERRQQIGMLRAIGFSRTAIALSFLMESSFTALLGIVSGIALGLLLAQQLVQTDDFVAGGVDSFYIPWVQILGIGGFAFICSLIMTIIPSRQASGIPIAEALRYE